jgi:hypothetical protein
MHGCLTVIYKVEHVLYTCFPRQWRLWRVVIIIFFFFTGIRSLKFNQCLLWNGRPYKCAFFHYLLTSKHFTSFSTQFDQLNFGLTAFLLTSGFPPKYFLYSTIIRPYQTTSPFCIRTFLGVRIFGFPHTTCNSPLVPILQLFSSFIGPYICLSTFHSHDSREVSLTLSLMFHSHCHSPCFTRIVTPHVSLALSLPMFHSHCHSPCFTRTVTPHVSLALSLPMFHSHCHSPCFTRTVTPMFHNHITLYV